MSPFAANSTPLVSIAIPGPIVDEIYAPLMYLPLAADGFAWINRYTENFLKARLLADHDAAVFLDAAPEALGAPADLVSIERLPPKGDR